MKCRLCGNDNLSVLTRRLRRGHGTVYYCPNCDYGMLEPAFENASEYYDGEYREKFKDSLDSEKETPEEIYEMRKDYQGDRLGIISNYYDESKSFLEIGSSAGQFLSKLIGKFGSLTGIELDTACVEYCRKILRGGGVEPELHSLSLENIDWNRDKTFDYIGFFQVLEHITDPEVFMKNVHKRLADNGRVFIEVPNLYDPLRSLWQVPEYEEFYYHEAHLSYFSEKSLRILLSMCGFEIEDVFFIQDYNFLNHLYWYYNGKPQKNCTFGLNPPMINFKDNATGKRINELMKRTNDEYFRILSESRLTSNMFVVAKKK